MSSTSRSFSSSNTNDDSTYTINSSEPDTYNGVAVVGMGCRVAGGVESPEQLWDFLLAQKDGSSEVPPARWEPYYNRDSRNKRILDKLATGGYFVRNLEDFDPQFFGISPREAEQMDPQQRISLEVVWEALQDAGIPAKSLKGTNTSVFWGVNSDDYSKLLLEDLANVGAWMGIGTAYCGVPNRVSYHLDLVGPSVAVDAACASSLVAVHNGISAILNGESNISIVGGVNALYGPGLTAVLQKAGALAPDGRCRSFDDGAVGYGRGEGAGAVILKDYAQAIRDGDHIRGIIKGSAVAHDGKTNGIMAPNSVSQTLVAKNALRVANLEASDIQYVEAHATSTPLGDPTEISAMSAVYGLNVDNPCYIGSIKPNIGHLEAGAGVMGLIKAVLAVEKGTLPPQANLTTLNSRVDWKASGLEVVQTSRAWPETNAPRRAAVCSYGYGGTVSHAVLEQYQATLSHGISRTENSPIILLVSANQKKRLPIVAELLWSWFKSNGTEENLASVCTTLATRRDHHEFRVSAVIQNVYEALDVLDRLRNGITDKWMTESRCLPQHVSKETVWVFSGHGAQWTDMGKELLATNGAFCKAIEPLDEVSQKETGASPIEWLRNGDFQSTDRIQILTYIMQIGIAAVLQSQGLFPGAVIGHSVGEIAASVVAGALSPVEGALIVTRRAILYRQVMGQGAMLLVNKSTSEVSRDLLSREDVVVSIDSSPSSCVVAGAKDGVEMIADMYKEQGVKTFRVHTDVGFHSPMMVPLCEPLIGALQDILHPTKPSVKLYSTTLSEPRNQDLRDAEYWMANMINPVRLTDAVKSAVEDGHRIFLEVASHPLISHSVTETLLDGDIEDFLVASTLRRDHSAARSLLNCLGQLHCSGVYIDWKAQMPGPWAHGLPTEPWLHQQILPKVSSNPTSMGSHEINQHSLVGHRIVVAGTDTVVYTSILDKDSKPFPGNHPVSGTEIVPAACLLNTFLRSTRGSQLQDIHLKVPVAIDVPRKIQVVVQGNQVRIMSQLSHTENADDCSWLTHTTGSWNISSALNDEKSDLSESGCRSRKRQPDSFTIDYLTSVGVSTMGFPWKVLEHYGDSSEMIARVDVAPGVDVPDWDPSSWAPFLDAATSIGSCIFFEEARLRMPSHVQQVDILTKYSPPKLGWIHVRRNPSGESCSDIRILDDQGNLLVKFTCMQFSEIEGTTGSNRAMDGLIHRVAWPPAMPSEEPLRIEQVILVSSDPSLMQKYASSLPGHVKSREVSGPSELQSLLDKAFAEATAIAYIPAEIELFADVFEATKDHTWQLLQIMKCAIHSSAPVKVFVLTTSVMQGQSAAALANAPLVGLSRVIASEHPDDFGGLIDSEDYAVPFTTMKYIQDADVIRILDGVPRTARLRALPTDLRTQSVSRSLPRPHGTYLVTGGMGALGLATAEFLAENGAQRLLLLSRRSLPPRSAWNNVQVDIRPVVAKIQDLERRGVSVHALVIDIGAPTATRELLDALQRLDLPPVLGVVHAAGVLENELILESTQAAFHRVFAPKVNGALALHEAFPPGTLDFFMLFSSCGQLLGFPGQGSYGSANAFLDTLATHRRSLGENSVAFQWTSWKGMGMGSDSEFVVAELEGKGITHVTRSEAFQAWKHLAQYDLDHGVVLRARTLDPNEPVPSPVLRDIITRLDVNTQSDGPPNSETSNMIPSSEPELRTYLDEHIRSCVASVLQLSPSDVDSRAALSDLGLDSVMSVAFRRKLQQCLKIPVPPTLAWNHPTVKHLVEWFVTKVGTRNM